MTGAGYRPRLLDGLFKDLLAELPAIMVTGPRAAGKTTSAKRHAASVLRLDRPNEAAAFRADPDAALREHEQPILLDEWQEVPAVLGAVKRAVDDDPGPGRFLLTGSVRAHLDTATWPGTGRVVRVAMYGMTVGEQLGHVKRTPLLDRLAGGGRPVLPADPPDLRGYIELALTSGFPDPALTLTAHGRMRWLEGYLEELLTRDVPGTDSTRDTIRLRRYLEAYALNTAGSVNDSTLIAAADINRRTAVAYERLLSDLFVLDALPAWTSNRLKRLSKARKRYLVDPALLAPILRLDAAAVMRDGDLLGRILDTFVVAQLRAELAICTSRPRLYHLRSEHGRHEIDIVAELGGNKVIAFEVKADSAPDHNSARHLIWLKQQLGDRFLHGAVLHTGPRAFELDEHITALPICALWG